MSNGLCLIITELIFRLKLKWWPVTGIMVNVYWLMLSGFFHFQRLLNIYTLSHPQSLSSYCLHIVIRFNLAQSDDVKQYEIVMQGI